MSVAPRAAIRALAAALAMLFAATGLYVAAFHAPHPAGLDVGVVGSPAQAAGAQRALDRAAPGGFDVVRFADEGRARRALLDTDIRGVLVPRGGPARVLVAGAFGAPVADAVRRALGAVAQHAGATAAVEDVRPLPAGDSRGLSSLFTVIGTLMPSLVFGALLAVGAGGLPARVRWAALAGFALLGGPVVALNVDVVIGAFDRGFAGIAVVAALLALAAAAAAHGLARLLGPAGVVVAVLVLLLLGLSASGGALTYELEPGFYRAVSQLLPPGAAVTAIRNVEYFDWAGTAAPLLVLGGWAAGGLALGAAGERLGAGARRRMVGP